MNENIIILLSYRRFWTQKRNRHDSIIVLISESLSILTHKGRHFRPSIVLVKQRSNNFLIQTGKFECVDGHTCDTLSSTSVRRDFCGVHALAWIVRFKVT